MELWRNPSTSFVHNLDSLLISLAPPPCTPSVLSTLTIIWSIFWIYFLEIGIFAIKQKDIFWIWSWKSILTIINCTFILCCIVFLSKLAARRVHPSINDYATGLIRDPFGYAAQWPLNMWRGVGIFVSPGISLERKRFNYIQKSFGCNLVFFSSIYSLGDSRHYVAIDNSKVSRIFTLMVHELLVYNSITWLLVSVLTSENGKALSRIWIPRISPMDLRQIENRVLLHLSKFSLASNPQSKRRPLERIALQQIQPHPNSNVSTQRRPFKRIWAIQPCLTMG